MLFQKLWKRLPLFCLILISELTLADTNYCSQLNPDHSEEIFDFPLVFEDKINSVHTSCAKKLINQILDFDSDGQSNYSEELISQLNKNQNTLTVHMVRPEHNPSSREYINLFDTRHTIRSNGGIIKNYSFNKNWQHHLVSKVTEMLAIRATGLSDLIRDTIDTPVDSQVTGFWSTHSDLFQDGRQTIRQAHREVLDAVYLNYTGREPLKKLDDIYASDSQQYDIAVVVFTLMQSIAIRSGLLVRGNNVEWEVWKSPAPLTHATLNTLENSAVFSSISHKLLFQR
ncbi:hypothetical protein [Endozoicomonas sp. OPT23]|uniref:hypothetical protein n=1 Tax=Endozoicomonas sp. OPT23 TaxID=2072845 RepID=UPI00129B6F4C|nr:hypothetical protein [Endozoicomonas sp. OPT23]